MNKCIICKKEFAPTRHSAGKYCSQKCYQSAPKNRIPLAERFWKFVNKTETCWLWTGSNDGYDGYGRIKDDTSKNAIGAHRASWVIHFGEIPDEIQVCHHCDNPPCVRPDHLFLGTNTDNQRDSWGKGRRCAPDNRGEKSGLHKLSTKEVLEIRHLYKSGASGNELARKYGVVRSTIYSITCRQRWQHLP